MNRKFLGLAGAALGTVMMATSAQAVTFDFTTANDFGNTTGNSLSFTIGSLTVTATAFYIAADGGPFATAALNQYSTFGLGVCAGAEYPTCNVTSPGDAQTDNSMGDEYVLFSFSGIVDPTTVTIRADYENQDQDVTYWLRSGGGTDNLAGLTAAGLAGIGFAAPVNVDNGACSNNPGGNLCLDAPISVAIGGSSTVTDLLFGAKLGDVNDFFKIRTLSVDIVPTVPEPASLALFGAALAGLGLARRRRQS